jgi:hypothetical protein
MKRRILLLLAAMGAVVVLWALFGGQERCFALADGTTVTFHGVSVGMSNRYNFGNPARGLAAKLPWPWAQKYAAAGILTAPVDGRTNLVLWVTYRGTAPRAGRLFLFRCIHDGGTNELAFNVITKYGLPSGEAGTAFYAAFWPRRSKRLTLQALEDNAPPGAKPLWEVRVTNPRRLDAPLWQPEVLPSSRTVGEMTFTLDQLVPCKTRLESTSSLQPVDAEGTQARLRVTRGGQPDNDWDVCGVSFDDPIIKRIPELRRLELRSSGGILDLDFGLPLLAGERAGKLGIAFVRARNFSTNELFTLAELELPSPGMDVRETLRTNSSFGQIEIAFIAHNSRSGEGINVSVFNDQRLRRDLAESDARWFEMLAATDDRGRSYSFSSAVHSYGYSVFHVKVPSDAKKLVLTVAAPRILFVEYTIGREDITRPK